MGQCHCFVLGTLNDVCSLFGCVPFPLCSIFCDRITETGNHRVCWKHVLLFDTKKKKSNDQPRKGTMDWSVDQLDL